MHRQDSSQATSTLGNTPNLHISSYDGKHYKGFLNQGNSILVPRPKLSIASSDRGFYISSADCKSYLVSYAFLALHKQDSASRCFRQQFAFNLHSVSVVHFTLIDAN